MRMDAVRLQIIEAVEDIEDGGTKGLSSLE